MRRSRSEMIAETRSKLISGARNAFARKGYANASMDDFTAAVGLTRGALYHHFGDKVGLFRAVIEQIDSEIDATIDAVTKDMTSEWERFIAESRTYLLCMLDPEIQQIVMRDGPAILGDISNWPSQNKYHEIMISALNSMMENGDIYPCDASALTRQINGALYSAAFGIANADDPESAFEKAWTAFSMLMKGIRISRE
ncbi:TetR/AcrR family transcriptional regulator [Bartonella sp. LJL80]